MFGSVVRPAPPPLTGGWENITEGFPVYFNCDGVRPSFSSGFWLAVAVMPGPESDVDVRLHNVYAGAINGFGTYLARSSWGIGELDYVLINYSLTDPMPFDAGVLRIMGDEDYTVEAPIESWMGKSSQIDHGPVVMPAGRMLDLYEVWMTPGVWHARIDNDAGDVDWGLSLHRNDMPFMNKNDVYQDAAAWYESGGEGEVVIADIETEGYYAITVWKTTASELPKEGTYTLHVAAGYPSGVEREETIPTVTRLAGVYPNPFNPQTTVEFDLASPRPVDLAVYDLTGRRVARLADEVLPAGRHRRVWTGRDDRGRTMASGVYVVRLRAGDVEALHKVLLVK